MDKKNATTITGKRQITLPAQVFRQAGLKPGAKLGVTYEGGQVILTPAEQALESLDGVLHDAAPKRWLGQEAKAIIEEARQTYLRRQRKK